MQFWLNGPGHVYVFTPSPSVERVSHQSAPAPFPSTIGAACAALADEDLLDVAPPDAVSVELEGGMTIELIEGAYATGGIGRHVYAAATALATLLVRRATGACAVPHVHGQLGIPRPARQRLLLLPPH